jgi:Protein of unknown function (DUF3168)
VSTSAPLLRGTEPLADMQRQVCKTLAEALHPVKVFDYVPESAALPYVTWGTAWLSERDTLNGCADRVWFQIDIWSTYRGFAEGAGIAQQVVRRLHHAVMYLDGYSPIHMLREQSHQSRDPDGIHRRIALTFNTPYVSPTGG